MLRRFAAVILSAILLAPGWLGATGFTLFAGQENGEYWFMRPKYD